MAATLSRVFMTVPEPAVQTARILAAIADVELPAPVPYIRGDGTEAPLWTIYLAGGQLIDVSEGPLAAPPTITMAVEDVEAAVARAVKARAELLSAGSRMLAGYAAVCTGHLRIEIEIDGISA